MRTADECGKPGLAGAREVWAPFSLGTCPSNSFLLQLLLPPGRQSVFECQALSDPSHRSKESCSKATENNISTGKEHKPHTTLKYFDDKSDLVGSYTQVFILIQFSFTFKFKFTFRKLYNI